MLVIDVSGSMSAPFSGDGSKLEAAGHAGVNLVTNKTRIDPMDEVGVVTFSDSATVETKPLPCGTHKHDLVQTLRRLRIGGGRTSMRGCKQPSGRWTGTWRRYFSHRASH